MLGHGVRHGSSAHTTPRDASLPVRMRTQAGRQARRLGGQEPSEPWNDVNAHRGASYGIRRLVVTSEETLVSWANRRLLSAGLSPALHAYGHPTSLPTPLAWLREARFGMIVHWSTYGETRPVSRLTAMALHADSQCLTQ